MFVLPHYQAPSLTKICLGLCSLSVFGVSQCTRRPFPKKAIGNSEVTKICDQHVTGLGWAWHKDHWITSLDVECHSRSSWKHPWNLFCCKATHIKYLHICVRITITRICTFQLQRQMTEYFNHNGFRTNKLLDKKYCPKIFPSKYSPNILNSVYLDKCANYCNFTQLTTSWRLTKTLDSGSQCDYMSQDNTDG